MSVAQWLDRGEGDRRSWGRCWYCDGCGWMPPPPPAQENTTWAASQSLHSGSPTAQGSLTAQPAQEAPAPDATWDWTVPPEPAPPTAQSSPPPAPDATGDRPTSAQSVHPVSPAQVVPQEAPAPRSMNPLGRGFAEGLQPAIPARTGHSKTPWSQPADGRTGKPAKITAIKKLAGHYTRQLERDLGKRACLAVEEENVKFITRLGLTQAECCERIREIEGPDGWEPGGWKHREWERTKHWSQEDWDEYKVRAARRT